jgi:formamidopyrimidine-DNA glycosylase
MPELPEVETVKRQLHKGLTGRKIVDLEIWKQGRIKPEAEKFADLLFGRIFKSVERRAKLLVFKLDDGNALTSHLKMTGKFVFVSGTYQPSKHDRILFILDDGARLVWSDVRQFGFIHHVSAKELEKILSAYGPEPLETRAQDLAERIKTPKTRMLKGALLNQEVVAGIGNIYADEACFRAGLRPTRRLGTLTFKDRLRVMTEAQNILRESIAQKGTSANDYVDTAGERGGFLTLLRVYGREGEPCRQCETRTKKIILAQRGTHYCPKCQK